MPKRFLQIALYSIYIWKSLKMTNTIKPIKRILNPKKLLNSKWTAVTPANKEKHFIVTKLISPDLASASIETILLEAVHSKHSQQLPWQALNDETLWLQGWQ